MSVVVDASAVVGLLVAHEAGEWVAGQVEGHDLAAPHLMAFEAANTLRRHELSGLLSAAEAGTAHQDLLDLAVALVAYEPLAERTWALRANITAYDGQYVALAEHLDVPLITLDRRLANAPGTKATIRTPPP